MEGKSPKNIIFTENKPIYYCELYLEPDKNSMLPLLVLYRTALQKNI